MAGSLILYRSTGQHAGEGRKSRGGRGGRMEERRSRRRSRCGCRQRFRKGRRVLYAHSCLSSSGRKCIHSTDGHDALHGDLVPKVLIPSLEVACVTLEAAIGDFSMPGHLKWLQRPRSECFPVCAFCFCWFDVRRSHTLMAVEAAVAGANTFFSLSSQVEVRY